MSFGPEYLYGLQAELNEKLPWRVSRVEGGESWVALRVAGRAGKPDEWLLLSWAAGGAGCCPADTPSVEALKKRALARTPLAEALKSRFLRGQIVSARQLNFDRVLELEVERFVAAGFAVTYFMVLEVTEPTGNLVLLDGDRKIEELARHASPDVNRYRTLLPGHEYVPPPAFEGLLSSETDSLALDGLLRIKGVGRPLLRMIGAHWEERPPDQWLEALRALYREEKGESGKGQIPLQRTSKGYFTRFPFLFPEAEAVGETSVWEAARQGVLAPLLAFSRSRLLRELDIRLERAAKSRERHLDGLLRQLENSAGADLFRRKGDLLLANLAAVPPGAKKVTLRDWNGREEVEIELNPGLSTARNAERYFKKYKKAHADPRGLQEEIASLRGAIEELRGQRDLLGSIEDPGKLEEAAQDVSDWLAPQAEGNKRAERGKKNAKKKERNGTPPLPPHLRFEAGGYTILVGLSARGNRFVTFKQAAGSDLWLHAHEIPGAHVVIKGAKGREELENTETLLFAASLAAAYSRDRNSLSVRVDYTERRHVRAVPGAATALVTYAHPGTIRVAPKPGALGPKESADGES